MGDETQVITRLETQKRNVQRVNVYIDEVYAFSLSLDEAARLRKGQSLSDAEIAALRGDDEVARAVERATRFLAGRPRSTHEVRQSLARKDVPPPVIELALDRLRALGYLDDPAFAEFWVSNRRQFKPLSARALRYELRQKGITNDIIDDVLEAQDEDDDAYRAAQAQVRRVRATDRAELRHKLMMFLARRGFSPRVSRDAVTRLLDELDADGLLADLSAEESSGDFDSE
jgi:regulatory protein